ncbi:hypothetical protein [Helicobacter pametensis]|uniref:hypothetical protein n=1 Tax=Helicobacter pametensis TaxID=95149 RepID=UPI0004896501|nr:hypothetical protein [Helicobacter pametensis]
MKIFGHPLIPSCNFIKISDQKEIDHIPAHLIVWWESTQDQQFSLAQFCQAQKVDYAVLIHNITDLLYFSHFGAKYLIASMDQIKIFQDIIREYLLDSLLLCIIQSEKDIESLALLGIDGVIFSSYLNPSSSHPLNHPTNQR